MKHRSSLQPCLESEHQNKSILQEALLSPHESDDWLSTLDYLRSDRVPIRDELG